MPIISVLRRLRQEDFQEFEARLDNTVSSRAAYCIGRPCLKTSIKKYTGTADLKSSRFSWAGTNSSLLLPPSSNTFGKGTFLPPYSHPTPLERVWR